MQMRGINKNSTNVATPPQRASSCLPLAMHKENLCKHWLALLGFSSALDGARFLGTWLRQLGRQSNRKHSQRSAVPCQSVGSAWGISPKRFCNLLCSRQTTPFKRLNGNVVT